MIHELKLSDRTIYYDLQRKKVKNINLRIKHDGKIFVSANESVSVDFINEFILKKEKPIVETLGKYEEEKKYYTKPKEFVDGETFLVFGHERRLKLKQANKNHVGSDGVYIFLFMKNTEDKELRRKITERWLNSQCREKIAEICETIYPVFRKYNIDFPELRFRNMISRWGSCQPKRKTVTFNYALINVPIQCIEYVIMHEFVHFLVPNHSKRFYEYLSVFLPDWRDRKNMLEKYGGKIDL